MVLSPKTTNGEVVGFNDNIDFKNVINLSNGKDDDSFQRYVHQQELLQPDVLVKFEYVTEIPSKLKTEQLIALKSQHLKLLKALFYQRDRRQLSYSRVILQSPA